MNPSNSKQYLLQGLIRKLVAAACIVGSFGVLGLPHTAAWSRISASSPSLASRTQYAPPKATTTKAVETEGASRRIFITNGWWV
ncbi:hypothetical protein [Nevskia sp.]|uniref:hypothetical protein n=1 Tax=Nevskia sp. TaxID=1929292 RepID=UPI0025DD5C17|nr:hypothetical protein [Nevskia sp.]